MTILDIVSLCRETEEVFRKYDEQAGECICCKALFETIDSVSQKYRLNLDQLLQDIEQVIKEKECC